LLHQVGNLFQELLYCVDEQRKSNKDFDGRRHHGSRINSCENRVECKYKQHVSRHLIQIQLEAPETIKWKQTAV